MDDFRGYNAEDIKLLSPREHIRLRPGMYIGGKDSRAMHFLLYEVLDFAVEDALVNQCSHIWIELRPDNEVSILDNTSGMFMYSYGNSTQIEALLENIGVSKRHIDPNIYPVTGGMYGVGLLAVNALCAEMTVENWREGILWRKIYKEGLSQIPLEQVEKTSDIQSGVRFTFKPDFTILNQNEFDLKQIETRVQQLAYRVPNLTIEVKDTRLDPPYEVMFHYPEGTKALIESVNAPYQSLHKVIQIEDQVEVTPEYGSSYNLIINIAFQFTDDGKTCVYGYINTIDTPEGTHIDGFQDGLLQGINDLLENKKQLAWNEIASGLTAVVSLLSPSPLFETKIRLNLINPEVYDAIKGVLSNQLAREQQVLENIVEHYLSRRQNG